MGSHPRRIGTVHVLRVRDRGQPQQHSSEIFCRSKAAELTQDNVRELSWKRGLEDSLTQEHQSDERNCMAGKRVGGTGGRERKKAKASGMARSQRSGRRTAL